MRLVGTDAVSKPVTRTLPDEQTREQFGERGFAGSVLADNAHELAGVERQVEVVNGGASMGVGKFDMVKGEHRLGVFRMRAQRWRVRGACGRPGVACRTVGVDDFRD